MLNIVLFGPPGAGKGTQSQFLREKYNLTYISTGEILREEIAAESELGLQVKEIISQGNLVSDEIVAQIIEKKLSENMDSAGFLFDGYPRTVRQAEILDEMMEKFGMSLTGVLSLEVAARPAVAPTTTSTPSSTALWNMRPRRAPCSTSTKARITCMP